MPTNFFLFVSAESDICTFALLKTHYASKHDFSTSLFSSDSRPRALRELYDAASKTPVHLMRQMDRWRRDGHRSSRFFLCTPVLGARRKRIKNAVDIDIETRMVSQFSLLLKMFLLIICCKLSQFYKLSSASQLQSYRNQ